MQRRPASTDAGRRPVNGLRDAMVEAVYSHLGDVRQRGEVVEFRVEPFAGILGERLRALRAGAGFVTAGDTAGLALRS